MCEGSNPSGGALRCREGLGDRGRQNAANPVSWPRSWPPARPPPEAEEGSESVQFMRSGARGDHGRDQEGEGSSDLLERMYFMQSPKSNDVVARRGWV